MLAVLLPGYKQIVSDFKDAKKAEMEEKLKGAGGADPYIQFRELADELRAKDQGAQEEKKEQAQEEKKEASGAQKAQVLTVDDIVAEQLKQKPWRQQIADPESAGGKLLRGGTAAFRKQNRVLLAMLSRLEGR